MELTAVSWIKSYERGWFCTECALKLWIARTLHGLMGRLDEQKSTEGVQCTTELLVQVALICEWLDAGKAVEVVRTPGSL